MEKTTFEITKMDCPSEENLIRMKLEGLEGIVKLDFDIPERMLFVIHEGNISQIEQSLSELKLGDKKIATVPAGEILEEDGGHQKKLLWSVLAINFAFFVIELTTGLLSKSMGLVADSLDMLADAFVYGISLLAVGAALAFKKKIARLAGYFQLLLAMIGFAEVIRRFIGAETVPVFQTMIIVSLFALLANGLSLYLLQKSKSKHEVHMKASMIFTSNDVIINIGVIVAAVLVKVFNSNIPDLIIGAVVFILVVQGARRILKLGN